MNDVLDVEQQERSLTMRNLSMNSLPTERTPGLRWDIVGDTLSLTVENANESIIRRSMLSYPSTLFDLFAFVSPFTLCAKLMFQQTCRN